MTVPGIASTGERNGNALAEDLLARVPAWERELLDLEQRAQALRSMIEGVRVLNGVVPDGRSAVVAGHRPRGIEAVLAVMREQPDRVWKLVEIRRALFALGWTPSSKAVDANIKRALNLGFVANPRYGFYCLPEKFEEMQA